MLSTQPGRSSSRHWRPEFRSEEIEELLIASPEGEDGSDSTRDPARKWLTEAEFRRLPAAKKYQLALDRYWTKRKTKWEIGRDYERFIGHEYETEGFDVRYEGIVEGFSDLGRDLIAIKGESAEIVQCKYWSSDKTIHEKHVFQLFGTLTAYRLDHPSQDVTGVFATSTARRRKSSRDGSGIDSVPDVGTTITVELPCSYQDLT